MQPDSPQGRDTPTSEPESREMADFAWDVHPARARPLAAVAATLVILAFAIVTYHTAQSVLAGVAVAVVLCLALHRFYFVSRYELSAEGIAVTTLLGVRRLRWQDIRLFQHGPQAAWLSPYRRRSWRDGRSGIHVLFAGRRADVLEQLCARLPVELVSPNSR